MIAAVFFRGPAWDDASGIVGQSGFVESIEAARAVVDENPVVRAGVLTYRLYEWGGEPLRRSR